MKMRLSQIQQSGATTGQAPVWTGTEWAPGTTGSALHASRSVNTATAGQTTLTLDAAPYEESLQLWKNGLLLGSGYTVAGSVVTFGSALAGGDVIVDHYWTTTASPGESVLSGTPGPALDAIEHVTLSDTFDGSSLDAKWTRVNYTGGETTVAGGELTLASKAAPAYIWQAAPAGDFSLVISYDGTAGNSTMFGLGAVDASGNGVMASPYSSPDAFIVGTVAGGSYAGGFEQTSYNSGTTRAGTKTWLRLRKSGTSYYVSASLDGAAWLTESPAHVNAATLARIGVGAWFGTVPVVDVQFFDVR